MAAAQVASHPIETVEESGSKKVRALLSPQRCCMPRKRDASWLLSRPLSVLMIQEYDELCTKLKEMSTLGGISGLLG